MDLMQLRAMAKINLGLDVVRKREDGYHEVRMIMQTIRMFDRVTVYRIPEPEIRISSNLHFSLFAVVSASAFKSVFQWQQVWLAAAQMQQLYYMR